MQEVHDIEFPQTILKNLTDKNEEKREGAGKELEIIIIKNSKKKHYQQIEKMIMFFKDKYIKSSDIIKKRGGIEALAFIINGIQANPQAIDRIAEQVVDIVLECLVDTEHKIRYWTLRCLFYICGTLKSKVLKYFNKIFQSIIGRMTDVDEQTKNAARFLDKSLHTILSNALGNMENLQDFKLKQFMQILKSKFKSMNPVIRLFLIDWINVLNQITTVDLLMYLPDILEDLLFMLGDKEKNLREKAEECLKIFQKELNQKFEQGRLESVISMDVVDSIVTILIKVSKGKSSNYSKLVTLVWFKIIFTFFKTQLEPKHKIVQNKFYFKKVIIERFDEILEPILLLMSHEEEEVRKASISGNDLLMNGIQMINKEETINFSKVMPLLKEMLSEKKSTSTSESVLKWMKFMLENYNDKILPEINQIIEKLVEKLCESQGKNVISIIQKTTVTEEYFQLLIQRMLILLMNRSSQQKPQQILKRFCSILQPDKFCKTLAEKVRIFEDRVFISAIVQHLNLLIITEKSMLKVRRKLYDNEDSDFFLTLFAAFKYNPAAATSLCLLSQEYELAYKIISSLGREVDIDQNILSGFCKLASLIECPGFLFLRLEMLNSSNKLLLECLCGILMIIPQGKLSAMLKNRLQISQYVDRSEKNSKEHEKKSELNIPNCYEEYLKTQQLYYS